MKTFLKWLVLIPVGIVLLTFAIINRHAVTVNFDPFEAGTPQLAVSAPLFIVMFAAAAVGLVVGGCATWLQQRHYRRSAARARSEASRLQAEIDRLQVEVRNMTTPAHRALTNRNAA